MTSPVLIDLVYLCFLIVLAPWLLVRSYRTGRYRRDLLAKLLGSRIPKFSADIENAPATAWFHGVSVGEIHLLVTIVAAFRRRHPGWRIVVSSTTDTGLAEARSRFSDLTVIPYPFDFSWAVATVLDTIRPTIIILAESELWPNLLSAAARRRIPVVVVNARLSPRSFARMLKIAGLCRSLLFRHIRSFAVQSEDNAERFRRLGVPSEKVRVTGSVKYDGAGGERDTAKSRTLAKLLGLSKTVESRPIVWVAGSTHPPEEEIVLRVFARLRARHLRLHLILVPRHPDRFEAVAALVLDSARTSGFTSVRRSQLHEPCVTMPDVILLDTIGELGVAWSLADIGLTGGSLDGQRGGQSMIEPAGYGVPTVFGPHIWNFRDAARRLIEAGGAIMIHDEAELETAIESLILDEADRTSRGNIAVQLVREQQGATERTLDVIDHSVAAFSRSEPDF